MNKEIYMPDDLKCNLLKGEFADCKKRVLIWVSALGKNGEPQELSKVALVAQERVETALKSAQFVQNTWENSPQFNKLLKVSEGLGKIAGYYKSISCKKEKIEKNYEALKQIYEAMKVLENEQVIYNDPAAAAAAFDKMFIGFGTLAKQFPPPFDSTVGEFLYELGTSGFFGNMQTAFNPATRPAYRSQWSQIEF
jgi:hypothetical protein